MTDDPERNFANFQVRPNKAVNHADQEWACGARCQQRGLHGTTSKCTTTTPSSWGACTRDQSSGPSSSKPRLPFFFIISRLTLDALHLVSADLIATTLLAMPHHKLEAQHLQYLVCGLLHKQFPRKSYFALSMKCCHPSWRNAQPTTLKWWIQRGIPPCIPDS